MSLSLATKTVGPPDNSYTWYLHSSGVALATGFSVSLGDGTATKLWIDSNGIGFLNAGGYTTSFRCPGATANQTLTFHYAPGEVYPELVAVLAADSVNSTTTAATVAAFSVTLEASALYEFELVLVFKSAATTTSPRFTLNGPTAQTDFVTYEVLGNGATNAQYTAWGTAGTNTVNAPGIATAYACRLRGICKTTSSTPASAVSLDIFSEVGASAITLCIGSYMRFRKLN
ncbi:MAG: hypothetical protein WCP45_04760 [Verrucomicrobiota bacterium]